MVKCTMVHAFEPTCSFLAGRTLYFPCIPAESKKHDFSSCSFHMEMDGGGFEPPKQFAADLQSVPFGHSGIHPCRNYILTKLNCSICLYKLQDILYNILAKYFKTQFTDWYLLYLLAANKTSCLTLLEISVPLPKSSAT